MNGVAIQSIVQVPADVIELPKGVRLLTLTEKMFALVFGCRHSWSRPFRFEEVKYPRPFNSHQSCVNCGSQRYFNGTKMTGGPIFRSEVGHAGKA